MKKHLLLLFLFYSATSISQLNNYDVGDTVNNFTVTDTNGNTFDLYNMLNQGKYVYIDFFATNCGTCQAKIPIFNNFYTKYGCNQGDVICISISVSSTDTDSEIINFEQQYGGNDNHHAPAVSIDGNSQSVVSDFGLLSYPTFCVIAPDHKLIVENITPVENVRSFAQTFPSGFNPPVMPCTSSLEQNTNVNIEIFPNPVNNGTFYLNTNIIGDYQVSIIDLNGTVLYKKIVKNNKTMINTNLNSGLYFINIISNKINYTNKLIIN